LDPAGCLDDALHPLAGKPYDYGVTTNPTGGNYTWIATKDPNFMTGGNLTSNVLTTSNGLMAMTGANTQSASITWSSQVLNGVTTTPTTLFVAVKYDIIVPCSTNNFKVYPIVPFKAFTIDLLSMDANAATSTTYGGTTSQCYDEVQSAKYDPVAGQVEYDYGVNVLWYELVAANFVDNYMPTFQLSGLQGTQTATVEWGYTPGTATNTLTQSGTGTGTLTYAGTNSVTTTVASNYDGVSIFVKVTVYNNSWEGDTGVQTITLAANAVNKDGDYDIVNTADMAYNTCSPLGSATSFDDTATQDLYQRPVLTPMPIAPGFIPDKP
jgi:hypothetical protein